jgi:SAM-dependent methyltransferase
LFDYDAELRRYHEVFLTAVGIGVSDRVLDIGCGSGRSTRDAARMAVEGSALGVDISAPMIEVARRRTAEEGLRNVTFELADAERHPFPDNGFDVAISRFGTMFFAEPVVAFGNIARALRSGGRLVMLVWQGNEHQEWSLAIREAVGGTSAGAAAFSLADPGVVRDTLAAAGFTEIALADLREPVFYGPDADAAYTAVLTLRAAGDRLATLTGADLHHARDRLRATLAARETRDGVWFDSRAWLVTASSPSHSRP